MAAGSGSVILTDGAVKLPVSRTGDPPPKPQPVLPACSEAPRPEHIPMGFAQQVLAQSALERHCPPINCPPFPLPTFGTPAGSNDNAEDVEIIKETIVC